MLFTGKAEYKEPKGKETHQCMSTTNTHTHNSVLINIFRPKGIHILKKLLRHSPYNVWKGVNRHFINIVPLHLMRLHQTK